MLQHALKIGLIVVVLGLVVQDANAFGHRGDWGCGYGYGGYGYGGCGDGSCGYGGYGYGGYGYGGYGGYLPSSDSVLLTVSVPADAKVFAGGHVRPRLVVDRDLMALPRAAAHLHRGFEQHELVGPRRESAGAADDPVVAPCSER